MLIKKSNILKIVIKFSYLLFFIALSLNSQWISNYYGNSVGDVNLSNARSNAITVDNNGYCYITGYVDENNGQGNDILLVKFNSSTGDTVWTVSYNGNANGDDKGNDLKVDGYGNVYVTGYLTDTSTGKDAITLKYSSSGEFIWALPYIGNNSSNTDDEGTSIALDSYGNIFITGFCTDSNLISNIILVKYSESGELLWGKTENGSDDLVSKGLNIAVDHSGTYIYVIGYITRIDKGNDICLLKFNESGYQYPVYYVNGNGNSEDRAFGIAVDDLDNVYITGYVTTEAISATTSSYTIKFDNSGTELWHRINTNPISNRAFGIAVDSDGMIYITGTVLDTNGYKDYMTVAYDSDGEEQWTSLFNGNGNGDDEAKAIGVLINADSSKSVLVAGSSIGINNNHDYATVRYDAGSGEEQNVIIYSMSTQTEDVAKDLVVDAGSNAYVTGFSQLLGDLTGNSCTATTLKFNQFKGNKNIIKKNIPSDFKLSQNYPNPFNPSTIIKFTIPGNDNVQLKIYDVTGRIVSTLINDKLHKGTYEILFNAQNLSSGTYFYVLVYGEYRDAKKMTLIK